jgi:hypothetical protein
VILSERLLWAAIGFAAGILALGYGLSGIVYGALLALGLGVLWLVGHWRRVSWAASLGLVLVAGTAAAGILQDVGAGWMLVAVIAALSAWDLDAFVGRLKRTARVEGQEGLERQHLLRLLIVNLLGLVLASVALGLRFRIGFGLVLLLAMLAVLGLSRAIGLLRQESD